MQPQEGQEGQKKRGRPATPRPALIATPAPSPGTKDATRAIGDIAEVWKHGRPYKYTNLGEIEALIDGYFLECDATGNRPNVSGLALALDADYKMLQRWEALTPGDEDPEALRAFKIGLSRMVSRAKTRAAGAWWANLEDRDKARGAEFALKVMGYQDRPDYTGAQGAVNVTNNTLVIGSSAEVAGLLAGILPKPLAGIAGRE